MQATDSKQLVMEYLNRFEARDLDGCLALLPDDATIHFQWRTYRGRNAVERWHKDRFEADLRIIRIDGVSVEGDVVTVDVVISSKRLRTFKLNSVGARVTIRLKNGAVSDIRFGVRKADSSKSADSGDDTAVYKAYVGPADNYDLMSSVQFNLLTLLGLRENHYLLDVGCGSLRAGKLFIPYLLAQRYFGIEPEQWLIEEGIANEIGKDLVAVKQPAFSNDKNFTLSTFDREFDYILAQSIFSHASRAQISRCLQEGAKVMNRNSLFVATFMEGAENYSGEEWLYPGPATYQAEFMANLVTEQGLSFKRIDWPHPNGQTWFVAFHPDREKDVPVLPEVGGLYGSAN